MRLLINVLIMINQHYIETGKLIFQLDLIFLIQMGIMVELIGIQQIM